MGDPHDRLKVVCAFDSDLARARGTVLRPPSAVSSFGGFRTPAAEYAAPSLKRPASETLHIRRHGACITGRNVRVVRFVNSDQALVRFGAGAANGTKIFYSAARRWHDRPLNRRREHEGRKALRHCRLS